MNLNAILACSITSPTGILMQMPKWVNSLNMGLVLSKYVLGCLVIFNGYVVVVADVSMA